jgi:hypothetical protein
MKTGTKSTVMTPKIRRLAKRGEIALLLPNIIYLTDFNKEENVAPPAVKASLIY